MYVPSLFRFEDEQEKIAFIKQYSFATMVTSKNGIPIATQLPFSVTEKSGKLTLSSHFAAANEQVNYLEEQTHLVIFSEPHAYISPSHYDKLESVPTWDYISVHAYGKAKIITAESAKLEALQQMIIFYDSDYMNQWASLSDKFKVGMMKGITVFELEISDLQGQKKISQNKNIAERQRIISHLESGGLSNELAIADEIRKL